MKPRVKKALSLKPSTNPESTYISPVFQPALNIVQGSDDFVFDEHGNKYIDFTSGIAVNSFGYRNHVIYQPLQDQLSKIVHTSNLFTTPPYIQLCKQLVQLTNKAFKHSDFASVFLTNSGTEANEAALKFAKLYAHRLFAQDDKVEFIAFHNSFHGRSMGSLSVTGQDKHRKPFEPLLPNVAFIEYNNSDMLARAASDYTAAIIVEPMQGEGGLEKMTAEFAQTINTCAKKHNIIVIADEIQTGLYRTGPLYASTILGLQPHIITLAKSLGGGFPLGAVITHKMIHDVLQKGDHGTTTGGNPVICNMALSLLKHLQFPATQLLRKQSSRKINREIVHICNKYGEGYTPLGSGHLRGITIPNTIKVDTIITHARKHGLLLLKTGNNSLRIAPSLVCNNAQIAKGFRILRKILHTQ